MNDSGIDLGSVVSYPYWEIKFLFFSNRIWRAKYACRSAQAAFRVEVQCFLQEGFLSSVLTNCSFSLVTICVFLLVIYHLSNVCFFHFCCTYCTMQHSVEFQWINLRECALWGSWMHIQHQNEKKEGQRLAWKAKDGTNTLPIMVSPGDKCHVSPWEYQRTRFILSISTMARMTQLTLLAIFAQIKNQAQRSWDYHPFCDYHVLRYDRSAFFSPTFTRCHLRNYLRR